MALVSAGISGPFLGSSAPPCCLEDPALPRAGPMQWWLSPVGACHLTGVPKGLPVTGVTLQ